MQLEEISKLIAHRRSIKPALMDAEKEVSKELWDTLFDAANWAPSHGHTEPWKFHVFAGDSRNVIAKALQDAYKAETPEAEFRPEKHEKMGKNPLFAHAVIAVEMHRGDNAKIPVMEEIEAVACAVQNMHLAASAAGLGLFWSSPLATYGQSFSDFLELREEDQCLGLLYIGFPKEGKEWPKSIRRPVEDKVIWK